MKDVDAKIISNKKIAPGCFEMELAAPEIAKIYKPGQFVMVRVSDSLEPLLRRPLCIALANGNNILLIYRVVGGGTEILARGKQGETLAVLGPLGRGFSIHEKTKKHVLVAGGSGLPPLLALAESLQKRDAVLIYGAKNAQDLAGRERVDKLDVTAVYVTEDGSTGEKGLATDALGTELSSGACVYACGPAAMLAAVEKICEKENVPYQFSLEQRMACGIGACQGCVTPVRTKNGLEEYRRVCVDGPVFDSNEVKVVW